MGDDYDNIVLPEVEAVTPSHGSGKIKPFSAADPAGLERARAAGRKGGIRAQQLRQEAKERRGAQPKPKTKTQIAAEARFRREQAALLRNIGIETSMRSTDVDKVPEQVRKLSAHILVNILGRIAGGDEELAPRNLKEAVDAAKTMQSILRLEQGQAAPDESQIPTAVGETGASSILDFTRKVRAGNKMGTS